LGYLPQANIFWQPLKVKKGRKPLFLGVLGHELLKNGKELDFDLRGNRSGAKKQSDLNP
jgi:hypothetical protein